MASVGLKIEALMTEGAIDRLVLASGGVARDFLSIFRRSVDVARERKSDTINAEDINKASGEYDTSKREEFKRDTYDEEENSLDSVFQKVPVASRQNDTERLGERGYSLPQVK
jgi:Cdc6-like AAA superfamily ATPase